MGIVSVLPKPSNHGALNATPGQLLAVAAMNDKRGHWLFINVLVNGQALKFLGSEKQLLEAVTAAGFPDMANHLSEGALLKPTRAARRHHAHASMLFLVVYKNSRFLVVLNP